MVRSRSHEQHTAPDSRRLEAAGPVWAEIDLAAIAHNVEVLKALVGPGVALCAVVKANGYGHGIEAVARTALAHGAGRLAIGRVREGVALRCAGITAPILILDYASPEEAENIVGHHLTPTVNSMALAQALSAEAQSAGTTQAIHLAVDTGMGRFGLLPEEVSPFAQAALRLQGLELEGFWTHFAVADERDKAYTQRQFELYRQMLNELEDIGIEIPVRHVANSAATLDLPAMYLDMVRPGIAIYGLYPSPHVDHSIGLRPAMSLKARVARVRTLPSNSSISYGRAYTTTRPTPVALVPAGYGDGYPRTLSGRGSVLIHGRRAPILGRVCMDQFVVDVSGIPEVKEGDEVVLLGRQGDAVISAEDLARELGTINYEVVTGVTARVPRVYLNGD